MGRGLVQVIAASPGFFVVTPIIGTDGKCDSLHESMVVAWSVYTDSETDALEGRSMAIPVIAEDILPELYGLKLPSGAYEIPGDRFDLTESDCIEIFNEDLAR